MPRSMKVVYDQFTSTRQVILRIELRTLHIERLFALDLHNLHINRARAHIKHCMHNMDSDLEAFNRNPTNGSIATLAYRLAAFAICVN